MRHLQFKSLRHPLEHSSAMQLRSSWGARAFGGARPMLSDPPGEPDADDLRATHYGLHLDGRFSGYARHLRPPQLGAADPSIRELALGLPDRVDHLCVHPEREADGLLLCALVRFVLAAIWVDAPSVHVLLAMPPGGLAEQDLVLLGERVQLADTAQVGVSAQHWLVAPVAAMEHRTAHLELKATLDDLGEQWLRSGSMSVLAGDRAPRWA
jgi:hypothetical protein